MTSTIGRFLRRISLTSKMLWLTVVVGVVAWAVLDGMQTGTLEELFEAQLTETFVLDAGEDQVRFDLYVQHHNRMANLLTLQKDFLEYINDHRWPGNSAAEVKYDNSQPPWLPPPTFTTPFVQLRYVLLFDGRGVLREVYQSRNTPLPGALLTPSAALFERTHGQNFITFIGDVPYLLTSETVGGGDGELPRAMVMLVSPLDSEFLLASLGSSNHGNIVALLAGNRPRILTSSIPDLLPAGTFVDELQGRYLSAGQDMANYGSEQVPIRFASFKSTSEVDSLTDSVLAGERGEHAIGMAVFILLFLGLMMSITRRVQRLGQHISDFSRDTLGAQQHEFGKGDQLYLLEQRFQRLTEEIVSARETMKNDAAEKILLIKENIDEKDKQLQLLQSVTETLGVGVIARTLRGLKAVNAKMEEFAKSCGGLKAFDIEGEESVEKVLCDKKSDTRVFHVSRLHVTPDGSTIFLVQDITELKAKTEALEHQALHDALTDLPNRTLLHERLHQAIREGRRDDKKLALLMMDLDRFKEINDTLGHHFGDLLLMQVSRRLLDVLRGSDTVARLGGDEFAVLAVVSDEEDAAGVAEKVREVIDKEFFVEDHILSIGISIGIAMFPRDGDDVHTLIQKADVAMYMAKQTNSGYALYDLQQDPHSLNRLTLIAELRHAIEFNELELYYQPKVDLKTRRVSAVEALVRWRHPRRGLVEPDLFIPIAEQTGLIKQLTHWVLTEAVQQIGQWRKGGIPIDMAVNLSAFNLHDIQLPTFVRSLVEAWEVDPSWLVLEITESAIMSNPSNAMEILGQLDEMGVSLSVDDFGTGYSSLGHLKQLPVDEIKVDRSFVMEMAENENDAVIVRATIDLAHNLGLKVIAEGVETEDVLQMLKVLNCDMVQGYFVSRPLSRDDFMQWLKDSPWGIKRQQSQQPVGRAELRVIPGGGGVGAS